MLPEPMFITTTWSVKGFEHIRVKLIERPGVNLYTSVESQTQESDAWNVAPESSVGHGLDRESAERRAGSLLSGGWKVYFPELLPKVLSVAETLKKPYARTFLLNDDGANGVFTALILEFPGCIAEGASVFDAYAKLQDAAESWILAMQANGNPIPEPYESVSDLHKLWTAVDKWRQEFPLGSPEELSRVVMKIVTPR
jgi:predicted RNase H-like HicB family nuclease